MIIPRSFLFGLFLLFQLTVIGQGLSLRLEQLSIEDGLPNPSVIDVLQDRQGFMWFGTVNGIVRYDGYDMEYFYPDAVGKDNLPERDLPRLYEDKSGNIWLGLAYQDARLFRYDPAEGRFIPYLFNPENPEQPIHNPVISILEDRLGRLLVGTIDGGLYVIDIRKEKEGLSPGGLPYKNFRHVPGEPNSLSNNALLRDMVEDGAGNVWISTEDGLNKFIPGEDKFEVFRYSNENGPGRNWISALCFEPPYTLLVSDRFHGLLKFALETDEFVLRYPQLPDNPDLPVQNWIQQIIKGKNGKYLLNFVKPSSQNYIAFFDPLSGRFTAVADYFGSPYGASPRVNRMIRDYSGNFWMASWQGGVFKYNMEKSAFHFLRPEFLQENVSGNPVITVPCEDSNGNLWIGTSTMGLVRWNREDNSFEHYLHQPGNPNSLGGNDVSSIALGPGGHLWMSTGEVVNRFDPDKKIFRKYSPIAEKASDIRIRSTPSGELWALYWGQGACRLLGPEEGTFMCFSREDGQPVGHKGLAASVAIEEDSLGNLYFGLNQLGFLRFKPKTETFEHFLPEYGVHDIHFDRYGNCWLATHSGGLKLFDWKQKRLIHLPEEEQARIGIARGILEDDNGYLWMKTPTGIIQFDPQARKVRRHFSSSNWIRPGEQWYNGFSRAVKISTGEMFYSSPEGLLYFHPDSLRVDSVPPKLALTGFRLFNEEVEPGPDSPLKQHISRVEKVTLSHWQNDITLAFAALHYKSPKENQYKYRLTNHDATPRDAGAQRIATYTNLPPGTYDFMLQAANSDGTWGDEQPMLRIIIRPPWYWNSWSIAVYLFLLAGGAYSLYRFLLNRRLAAEETRRILEMGQFKSRFYTNITHEFRTPLTLILGAAGQLEEKNTEGIKKNRNLIQRQGRHLLKLVNQLLDLSKLESHSMSLNEVQADIIPFVKGVAASFESAAVRKGLQMELQCDTDSLVMDFDPEKLQAILYNLLSNALKFTPEGGVVKCEVGSRKSEDEGVPQKNISDLLRISVRDTGPGISPEQLPHIFDRFYQVDNSSTREGEGTGIGLALAKELVGLMGGRIEVQSQRGQGSEFRVLLPVRQSAPIVEQPLTPEEFSEQDEERQAEGAPLFPGPESIEQPLALVVEDNPDMAAFIHSLLEDNYRVQLASDGEEGVQKAIEWVPDVVISDVMMPKKDGFELCDTLKKDERTSHIPVILLTARAGQEHRIEGLQYGADAYLEKPFDRKELEVRLQQLIALRKTLQQRLGGQLPPAPGEASAGDTREAAFLKKLQKIILEQSADSDFGVAELCQMVGMSRTQLHNKLKALSGQPTSRFIRSVRLAEAKKLLLNTSLSVSEISFRVGFRDANFFSTCFKEAFGEAPSRFRKR